MRKAEEIAKKKWKPVNLPYMGFHRPVLQ